MVVTEKATDYLNFSHSNHSQYTHELRQLTKSLSAKNSQQDEHNMEEEGPPLMQIVQISQDEIKEYRRQLEWLDNPAYQPDNHKDACKALGIVNPDMSRIDGLSGNMTFAFYQPVAIQRSSFGLAQLSWQIPAHNIVTRN